MTSIVLIATVPSAASAPAEKTDNASAVPLRSP
jgi:hypothetical protein